MRPALWVAVWLGLVCGAGALNGTSLVAAFATVFQARDRIENEAAMAAALNQLAKMGIDPLGAGLCALGDDQVALVLMKAALAEYVMGLQDKDDWSVVVADLSTGQLTRTRSFSAVRFAVIETLLLIAVVALGRAIWLRANKA